MDLEENGYVQKRIRFFMGLNFIWGTERNVY